MTVDRYADEDLRAEAAICLRGLSTTPDEADIRRWLPGAYIESHRKDDGRGRTWGALLDENGLNDVSGEIHGLIEGAADVARWAVDLGADGLEPSGHTLQLGVDLGDGDQQPRVRLHFAFHPDMDDEARARFTMRLGKAVLQAL